MANKDIILVTGATGKQGGSTLGYLAKHGGFRLRAMTRNPDSDSARALKGLGVELVKGDLDDAASLERAVAGAWGVYAVQNTWEAGVAKEEEQRVGDHQSPHASGEIPRGMITAVHRSVVDWATFADAV